MISLSHLSILVTPQNDTTVGSDYWRIWDILRAFDLSPTLTQGPKVFVNGSTDTFKRVLRKHGWESAKGWHWERGYSPHILMVRPDPQGGNMWPISIQDGSICTIGSHIIDLPLPEGVKAKRGDHGFSAYSDRQLILTKGKDSAVACHQALLDDGWVADGNRHMTRKILIASPHTNVTAHMSLECWGPDGLTVRVGAKWDAEVPRPLTLTVPNPVFKRK